MSMTKLLAAAIGGAALWHWAQHHKERDMHRRLARPGAKPREVTTWEGEGGALRSSGPQLAATPEVVR